MLDPRLVNEVRRLLAEGRLSQRQIAHASGVSRASVGLIARGKRPNYAPRPLQDDWRPSGPACRCHGCGGMVYLPCRLCQVRAIKARERQQQKSLESRNQGPEPEGVENRGTGLERNLPAASSLQPAA